MMHRIRQAEEADKKPSSYYMRVLKEAKRRSIEEFAVALGVTEEAAEARLAQAALNLTCQKGQVYFGRFYLAKRQTNN